MEDNEDRDRSVGGSTSATGNATLSVARRPASAAAAAAASSSEAPPENDSTSPGEGGDSKKKFPWALHRLLEDTEKEGDDDIVCWRPSGVAFQVIKRDQFMKKILPRYFKQSKFKSFVRQLNLWGFTILDKGPDKGSYYHSKFARGKQHLCHEMSRQKKPKPSSTSPISLPVLQQYPQHLGRPISGVPSGRTTTPNIGIGGNIQIERSTPNIGIVQDLSIGPARYGLESERGLPAVGSSFREQQQQQQHSSLFVQHPREDQRQLPRFQMASLPPPTPAPLLFQGHIQDSYLHTTNESNSNLPFRSRATGVGGIDHHYHHAFTTINESPRQPYHGNTTNSSNTSQNWSDTRLTPERGVAGGGGGDWLDRLEAMFCPTDTQISGGGSSTRLSWLLEPRPIRTPSPKDLEEKEPSK